MTAEYYHTGAGAYITRPPLSLPTGISVNLRLLGVTGRTETRLYIYIYTYIRVSLRCVGVGARMRGESRGAARRGATGEGGDGRKNDGHKYRSYLCFMTVRPRYRQEESARIRGKAPTIDSQILTDVLAQWIPVSPVEPPPLSLFFSLFSSLLVEGGPVLDRRRMASVATQSANLPLFASADPNLRYLLYDSKEKREVRISTLWSLLSLYRVPLNCHMNYTQRYFLCQTRYLLS